jgi:HAD superfamily hydrolase (TIGR01509 family)
MIDTVLFDFAGTLAMPRFGPEHVQAAARSIGLSLSSQECGRIAAECWSAGLPGGPPPRVVPSDIRSPYDERDLSSDAHRAAYVGLIATVGMPDQRLAGAIYDQAQRPEGWLLYADARGVIEALERRGVRVGVLSNVGFDIRPILLGQGLEMLARFCTMSYVVGATKPDPRIFEAALRAIGSEPARALMVGDHEVDRGGEAVGIRTLILPMSPPGGEHGLSAVLGLL